MIKKHLKFIYMRPKGPKENPPKKIQIWKKTSVDKVINVV